MLYIFVLALTAAFAASDTDWSRFRGPNGSGVSETKGLPTEFGPDKNVIWKVDLPQGYSSPIVHGDRIYLTAQRDESLLTLAVDRSTGKILWERAAPRDRRERLDKRNRPAAASAATDGTTVTVFFGDYGLITYDVNGKELWKQPLGPFNNVYGMGASPILVGNKVILVCDQSTNSYIAAWDKKTGKKLWQTPRTEAKSGHSTPILWTPRGGRTQVIVPGSFLLSAYDPDNGKRLALATQLGRKAAADRYAAFLDLLPSLVSAKARSAGPERRERALDAYEKVRELVAVAPRLSLDPAATVFQLSGILASVAD